MKCLELWKPARPGCVCVCVCVCVEEEVDRSIVVPQHEKQG